MCNLLEKRNVFADDPKFPQNLNLLGPLFRAVIAFRQKTSKMKFQEIFRDNLNILAILAQQLQHSSKIKCGREPQECIESFLPSKAMEIT